MNLPCVLKLLSLDGQKAIITGAGSGIGQATAIALANFGAEVMLLDKSSDGLKETEAKIAEADGKSQSCVVDISQKGEVDRFFETYQKEHERLDIFVSNAGRNIRVNVVDATEDEFDALMNTNFKGAWFGLQKAARMMQQQRSGNIVVVTSINGLLPLSDQAIYSSTKAALQSLTQSLAATLAPYGVRVNSCAPGCILTNINNQIFSVPDIYNDKVNKIPLGRLGSPMDIGNVIATMATDAYRFMTGTTVIVDGGESLRPKTYLGER